MMGSTRDASFVLDGAIKGKCVVISISKASNKGDTSLIYARRLDGVESSDGQVFRLAKLNFRYIWQNDEIGAAEIRFGSIVKYVQVGDEYLFHGNTNRRQTVDKIQMDLSYDDGGAFRGIRHAFPDAIIDPKGIHQDCRSMQSLQLISLKYGKIKNERIIFKTKLDEHVNLKLNCRQNLVLSTSPVVLQLRHGLDGDDVGDVALVKIGDSECGLRHQTFQAVCEGLILKHKPKEISPEDEPVEIMEEDGNFILVPGSVKLDTGCEFKAAISMDLVDVLSLEPDNRKKTPVSIPGGGSLQCSRVRIDIKIRTRIFTVDALVGAVAKDTDLLIGMPILQELGGEGFVLKLEKGK